MENTRLLPQHSAVAAPQQPKLRTLMLITAAAVLTAMTLFSRLMHQTSLSPVEPKAVYGAAWSSVALPFSTVNPEELVIGIDRPLVSRPGAIFDKVPHNLAANNRRIPLPTNSWLESLFLGDITWGPSNRVFQVPYIVDTNGYIQGVRAHPAHVQANSRQVEMVFESRNGLTLGAVERFSPQHHLLHDNSLHPHGVARLSAVLEWSRSPSLIEPQQKVPSMRAAIVRGAPYMSMVGSISV
jgi:hypothetical protein